ALDDVLPPDAPPGHEAYYKLRTSIRSDRGKDTHVVQWTQKVGQERIAFQCTAAAAGNSSDAALRLARACYVMLEQGQTKEEVTRFRNECYTKLKAKETERNEKTGRKQSAAKTNGEAAPREGKAGDETNGKPDKKEKQKAETPESEKAEKSEKVEAEKKVEKADKKEKKDKKEKTHAKEKKEKLKKDKAEKDEDAQQADPPGKASKAEKNADAAKPSNGAKPSDKQVDGGNRKGGDESKGKPTTSSSLKGRAGAPPESFPDFDPKSSNLSDASLAALPPEADGAAFEAVWRTQKAGKDLIYFISPERFQVTCQRVAGNWYAAFRIARACWAKFTQGSTKEEVLEFRSGLYEKFNATLGEGEGKKRAPKSTEGKKRGRARKEKKQESSSFTSSSSDSSDSESAPATKVARTIPRQRACAKMLVRSGLRCVCHYQLRCPDRAQASARPGTAGTAA
ncbi:unnamed protein product, partial [Effrenium voratum]